MPDRQTGKKSPQTTPPRRFSPFTHGEWPNRPLRRSGDWLLFLLRLPPPCPPLPFFLPPKPIFFLGQKVGDGLSVLPLLPPWRNLSEVAPFPPPLPPWAARDLAHSSLEISQCLPLPPPPSPHPSLTVCSPSLPSLPLSWQVLSSARPSPPPHPGQRRLLTIKSFDNLKKRNSAKRNQPSKKRAKGRIPNRFCIKALHKCFKRRHFGQCSAPAAQWRLGALCGPPTQGSGQGRGILLLRPQPSPIPPPPPVFQSDLGVGGWVLKGFQKGEGKEE